MDERNEVQFWRDRGVVAVGRIVAVAPLSLYPTFYDSSRDQYFSSNPNGKFLAVDTLKRLFLSYKLIQNYKGLHRAEVIAESKDWQASIKDRYRLIGAIRDVKLCRGAAIENA